MFRMDGFPRGFTPVPSSTLSATMVALPSVNHEHLTSATWKLKTRSATCLLFNWFLAFYSTGSDWVDLVGDSSVIAAAALESGSSSPRTTSAITSPLNICAGMQIALGTFIAGCDT